MRNRFRRGDADTGAFIFVVGAIAVVFGWTWFWYETGHEQGVSDGISGKYVIDTLSDGTTKVVRNKDWKDAQAK